MHAVDGVALAAPWTPAHHSYPAQKVQRHVVLSMASSSLGVSRAFARLQGSAPRASLRASLATQRYIAPLDFDRLPMKFGASNLALGAAALSRDLGDVNGYEESLDAKGSHVLRRSPLRPWRTLRALVSEQAELRRCQGFPAEREVRGVSMMVAQPYWEARSTTAWVC